MADTVIIPAAGSQVRWGHVLPKQLVWVDGERVIVRLIRQLAELGKRATVITQNEHIINAVEDCAAVAIPGLSHTLCETLLSTKGQWIGRVLVLLGDVIASDDALAFMANGDTTPMVYGTQNEIFALVFDETQYSKVAGCLYDANELAKVGQGNGKLWDFFDCWPRVNMT